jgi:hypothetical protein
MRWESPSVAAFIVFFYTRFLGGETLCMKIPILSSLFKDRGSPRNSFWQNAYAFFFGPTPSGKTVNERTAMATSAVYACVRVFSETIASLPIHRLPAHRARGRKKPWITIYITCSMMSPIPR